MTLIYLVAMVALGVHLHHGIWSAAQTLGLTNNARARRNAKTPRLDPRRGHRRRLLARPDLRPRRRHRPSKGSHAHDRHAGHHPHVRPVPRRPAATTATTPPATTRPASRSPTPRRPSGPIDERWQTRKFEARLVNPANRRKLDGDHRRHRPGRRLRRGHARRGRLQREVLLLPGLPAPRALDRRPGRHQRGQELQGTTATPSTGSSTTPSRAATTARASPTSTGWPRSARTSSTSASRRASRSPASTAACSTTAPSAASRSPAPSTPAARPASSC